MADSWPGCCTTLSGPRQRNRARGSSVQLRGPGTLRIAVIRGGQVRTLINTYAPAQEHEVSWDGRDAAGQPVAAGVYFARLAQAQNSASLRLVRTP